MNINPEISTPVDCFCGCGGLVHVMPYYPGEDKIYRVECSSPRNQCGFRIMYHNSEVDFPSEEQAINAWNAIMTADYANG